MPAAEPAVYIVDGLRTPFLKAKEIGPFSASDLAVAVVRQLFLRMPFEPAKIGELIAGCVIPREYEANIGRIIALRAGCGDRVPAFSVQRNCASGMQSIDNAFRDILQGRCELAVAGGCEAMSHSPLNYRNSAVEWFSKGAKQRGMQRLKWLLGVPLRSLLNPVISVIHGLTDPVVQLSMGQTAEVVAHHFQISRESMDQFSAESHRRLAQAIDEKRFVDEMVPLFDQEGGYYDQDTGLRRDSNLEQLAKLPAIFDKRYGNITAGNSSQVTDGACFLLLASAAAVKKYQLPVLARIRDCHWAACSPAEMGLGPVYAATPLLQKYHYSLDDIDYWEINEAFAAQVLGCLHAWQDTLFCKQELGLNSALGHIDFNRLNVDGGAVALGHPVGASGARIVLHLARVMQRNKAKRGIAAICIGGGQGGAMLLEGVNAA